MPEILESDPFLAGVVRPRSRVGRRPGHRAARVRSVISILAVSMIASGCGKQHGSESARPVPGGTDQAITVDAHDLAFRPSTITVEREGEVVVTVENRGRLRHTFTTDYPSGDVVLEPGNSRSVRLPTGNPVTFFCRFHEASGMRGVICPRGGDCLSPR